jgi:hypothetical protein
MILGACEAPNAYIVFSISPFFFSFTVTSMYQELDPNPVEEPAMSVSAESEGFRTNKSS